MLRVLIIDDEKLVLDELEACLDWRAMGFEIAGKAQNGLDGLKLMEKLLPDIVITDVKMPVMNGLTFARKAREMNRHLKIIFVSGYDEFDFVKQAVNVEAFAYILKPVDIDELKDVMINVRVKCEQDNAYYQINTASIEKYIGALLPEENDSKIAKLVNNLTSINESFRDAVYTLLYVSIDGFNVYEDGNETKKGTLETAVYDALSGILRKLCSGSFVCSTGPGNFCCLMGSEDDPYERDKLLTIAKQIIEYINSSLNVSVTISINRNPCSLAGLPAAYASAAGALGERFYSGYGRIFMSEDEKLHIGNKDIKVQNSADRFMAAIRHGDTVQVDKILTEFFSEAEKAMVNEASFKQNVFSLFAAALHEYLPEKESSADFVSREMLYEGIHKRDTLSSLRAFSSHIADTACDFIASDESGRHAKIVEKAIGILHASYSRQLTIEELARQLYLSPSYLRGLFKKITGDTIYNVQTKIRMEKAEQMLSDPDRKIKDIAQHLGFEYTSHFIALFSRHKGMTPLQYRNSIAIGSRQNGNNL